MGALLWPGGEKVLQEYEVLDEASEKCSPFLCRNSPELHSVSRYTILPLGPLNFILSSGSACSAREISTPSLT